MSLHVSSPAMASLPSGSINRWRRPHFFVVAFSWPLTAAAVVAVPEGRLRVVRREPGDLTGTRESVTALAPSFLRHGEIEELERGLGDVTQELTTDTAFHDEALLNNELAADATFHDDAFLDNELAADAAFHDEASLDNALAKDSAFHDDALLNNAFERIAKLEDNVKLLSDEVVSIEEKMVSVAADGRITQQKYHSERSIRDPTVCYAHGNEALPSAAAETEGAGKTEVIGAGDGTTPELPIDLRNCIDRLNAGKADEIRLRKGRYVVEKPLEIRGVNGPTIIAAYNNETVILDGSVKISKYLKGAVPKSDKKVLTAELKASFPKIFQLFYDLDNDQDVGEMLVPARWPNAVWTHSGPRRVADKQTAANTMLYQNMRQEYMGHVKSIKYVCEKADCTNCEKAACSHDGADVFKPRNDLEDDCFPECLKDLVDIDKKPINIAGAMLVLNVGASTFATPVTAHCEACHKLHFDGWWGDLQLDKWANRSRYYLEGHLGLLDAPGEWHFDGESSLSVYKDDRVKADLSNLRGRVTDYVLRVRDSSKITIANITLFAGGIDVSSEEADTALAKADSTKESQGFVFHHKAKQTYDSSNPEYFDNEAKQTCKEAMTVMVWVNPSTRGRYKWQRLIGKGTWPKRPFGLWMHSTGRVLSEVYLSRGRWLFTKTTLPLRQWTHLALVWMKGGRHQLYINGTLDMSLWTSGDVKASDSGAKGRVIMGWRFSGYEEDARVYNYAMEASAIKKVMTIVSSGHEDGMVNNIRWDGLRFLFPSASKRILGDISVPKPLTLDAMGANRSGVLDQLNSCRKKNFTSPAKPHGTGSFEVENCVFFGGDGPVLAYTGQNLVFKNNEVKYFDYSGHHQVNCRDDGKGLLIFNIDGSGGETFERNTIWMTGSSVGYRPGAKAVVRENMFAFVGDLHGSGAAIQAMREGVSGSRFEHNWIMYTGSDALSLSAPRYAHMRCDDSILNIRTMSAVPIYDQVVDNGTVTFNVFYKSGQFVAQNDGHEIIRNTGYWVSHTWQDDTLKAKSGPSTTRSELLEEYYKVKESSDKADQAMFYMQGQAKNSHGRTIFVLNRGETAIDAQIDERTLKVACRSDKKPLLSAASQNIPGFDYAAEDLQSASYRTRDGNLARGIMDFENFDFRPSSKDSSAGAYDFYTKGDYTYVYDIPGRLESMPSFPVPPNGSCTVEKDANLMFRPAAPVAGVRTYSVTLLGESPEDKPIYLGGSANVFEPNVTLHVCKKYSWRVDMAEQAPGMPLRWITGKTWHFRVRCPGEKTEKFCF